MRRCFPSAWLWPIFQYFNIFSMMYTGKPLVTTREPYSGGSTPGNCLFTEIWRMRRWSSIRTRTGRALVPSSWELVRRRPGGHTETIAKNVLTFDLAERRQRLVYSDGASIVRIGADGHSERVLESESIDQVLAL